MTWIKKPSLEDGKVTVYFTTPKVFDYLSGQVFLSGQSLPDSFGSSNYSGLNGWVKEDKGSLYMIPDQGIDSSEFWIGVRDTGDDTTGKEKCVHFIGKSLYVIIDDVPEEYSGLDGIINTEYKNIYKNEAYNFYAVSSADAEGAANLEANYLHTRLMSLEEIVNYSKSWIDILSDFPNKDFSDIGIGLKKRGMIKHFKRIHKNTKKLI